MGPWTTEQIDLARRVKLNLVLDHLGAYYKRDPSYEPLDPGRKSVRVFVNHLGRDFRFVITGEKWVNELMSPDMPNRGGGGTIDFVRHITGFNFVQAVRVCMDAVESARNGGSQ